jgi:hypothetical protein
LDAYERDRAEARNVVGVDAPIKAIDAVRPFECDAHERLGDDDFKVASNWMLDRVPQFGLALRATLRTFLENASHRTSPRSAASP